MYKDKVLRCRVCGSEFVFTAAEQEFYAEKGFATWPKRCKECRQTVQSRRKLYKGICAACGRETQVPFMPDETRLVYCRDCYAQITAERRAEKVRKSGA